VKHIKIILTFLLILSSLSYADEKQENDWNLKRFNIYFENDIFRTGTDSQYSSGEKFGLIYQLQNQDYFFYDLLFLGDDKVDSYINFSIVNQIFTPADLTQTQLIEDDRSYAGWTFFETGIHKSSKNTLQSLYIQIGTIGPRSRSEQIQTRIHEMTDSELPMGWDNQLEDEFGFNLRYIYKLRYATDFNSGMQAAIIPYTEAELGNVSIQGTVGFASRIGWNIQKDFGMTTINTGGENGIPIYGEANSTTKSNWSFSFNFNGSGSAVGRNIFLDGNTLVDSHSVERNYLIANLGLGISARYKQFALDYIYQKGTKQYESEDSIHGVGSVVASWIF